MTRTLDLATFTVPTGWHVEERGTGDGRHDVMWTASATASCSITVYASRAASGNLAASFAAEWTRVALQTLAPVPTPGAPEGAIGDLRVAIGGAASNAQGQPMVGLLIVADAGSRVVPILLLTPSFATLDSYRVAFDPFLASVAVRRVDAPAPPEPRSKRPELTLTELAGEWGCNDGINTRYVDRQTGDYAGTDSLHFTEKWTISASGSITLDFFGIHNGRRIVDKSTGVVSLLADGILVIRMPNEQRFVVRGWEPAADMTVMTLNGPWYDYIPPEILANPQQGANLDQRWVRLSQRA